MPDGREPERQALEEHCELLDVTRRALCLESPFVVAHGVGNAVAGDFERALGVGVDTRAPRRDDAADLDERLQCQQAGGDERDRSLGIVAERTLDLDTRRFSVATSDAAARRRRRRARWLCRCISNVS